MGEAGMIEQLPELVNANAALVRRGRWTDVTMLLEIGETRWLVEIRAGRIERLAPQINADESEKPINKLDEF